METDDYSFTLYYNSDYSYLGTWSRDKKFFRANDSIPALGTLDNVCLCFKVPVEVESNANLPLTIQLEENYWLSDYDDVGWVLR